MKRFERHILRLLDAYARRPLWQDGLEYGHGTGHGIGAYLNVHEGPAQIGGGCVGGDKSLDQVVLLLRAAR